MVQGWFTCPGVRLRRPGSWRRRRYSPDCHVVPGRTADTRIFRLHGPITLSNLFDFQKVLTGGTEKVTILDFTESEYIDSAGLGVILNYYVSGKRHGRTIRLVAVNYRVAELLKLTSANTLIKTYDSIEAAEAATS
jgi:anti-anti-sigma factor